MTSFGRFFLRIMSRVKKRTSNVCSKQHAKTQMACKKSGFEFYRQHVGPIETQGSWPLQQNLREHTRVINQMCAVIPQQYIHRQILSMSTLYLAVDATPGGCTKY